MQFDLTKIINANATYIVLQLLCLEHKTNKQENYLNRIVKIRYGHLYPRVRIMVINATFNNILVISRLSVLLVDEEYWSFRYCA
jgi:hypothetical protein